VRAFTTIGGGEFLNLAALETLVERFGRRDGWAAFNDWLWINDPAAPTYTPQRSGPSFVPGRAAASELPPYLRDGPRCAKLSGADVEAQARLIQRLGVGPIVAAGSYAWAVSPELTGTGYPILVGQPQTEPSVPGALEVELSAGDFRVVGNAGLLHPAILAGHNGRVAWSLMVGMNDGVDIYREVLNPVDREQYLHNGRWLSMEKRTETIPVAGEEPRRITFYRTLHGPVVSPLPFDPASAEAEHVYSRKTTVWKKEPLEIEAMFRLTQARDATAFGAAMQTLRSSMHYIYADIEGNIGYWHTGLVPERVEGFDPRLPLPGTGEAEWTGRSLPSAHVLNPAQGFIAGWNTKASPDARNPFHSWPNWIFGRYHRGLWLQRALSGRTGIDRAETERIIRHVAAAGTWRDNHHNGLGGAAKDLLPFMARAVAGASAEEAHRLRRILEVIAAWDGRSVDDVVKDDTFQPGHTIFLDWLPRLMETTFGDELEGVAKLDPIDNQVFNLFLRCLDGASSSLPVSRNYFDKLGTETEETADDIFLETLRATAAELEKSFGTGDPGAWRGPRAKRVYRHRLFGKVAEMWDVNVGSYVMLAELRPEGAVGFSRWALGQSGHVTAGADGKPVFAPHSLDMLPLYEEFRYQKMGLE